jgi:hypothetical protein
MSIRKDDIHSKEVLMKKHWDGKGHEILDFFGMRMYYQFDPVSLGVIMKAPPHRYEVIPTKKIMIDKDNPKTAWVYAMYPVSQTCAVVELSERHISRLRDIYSKKLGWTVEKIGKEIWFTRPGRLKIIEAAPQGGAV